MHMLDIKEAQKLDLSDSRLLDKGHHSVEV